VSHGTRRLALPAALALLVAPVAVGTAAEEPRRRPGDTTPPVTVSVSEELDVSGVRETDGGSLGDDPATFERVDDRDATFRLEDPETANFTGVDPGLYDSRADGDDAPELRVVRPRVARLVVRTRDGTNLTDGRVSDERLELFRVVAAYDFDEADRLQVTLSRDGTGVGLDPRAARITEGGESYTTGTVGRPPGPYTVTVTGSAIEAGTRSVTVGVGEPPATATPTPTPIGAPTPTPTAADGPGPGVAVAVGAPVIAALVRRRGRR
jgi:hypothetical protein